MTQPTPRFSAILAGADIALICHSEDAQEHAVDAHRGGNQRRKPPPGAGGGLIGSDTETKRKLLPPELASGNARSYRVRGTSTSEGENPLGTGASRVAGRCTKPKVLAHEWPLKSAHGSISNEKRGFVRHSVMVLHGIQADEIFICSGQPCGCHQHEPE